MCWGTKSTVENMVIEADIWTTCDKNVMIFDTLTETNCNFAHGKLMGLDPIRFLRAQFHKCQGNARNIS